MIKNIKTRNKKIKIGRTRNMRGGGWFNDYGSWECPPKAPRCGSVNTPAGSLGAKYNNKKNLEGWCYNESADDRVATDINRNEHNAIGDNCGKHNTTKFEEWKKTEAEAEAETEAAVSGIKPGNSFASFFVQQSQTAEARAAKARAAVEEQEARAAKARAEAANAEAKEAEAKAAKEAEAAKAELVKTLNKQIIEANGLNRDISRNISRWNHWVANTIKRPGDVMRYNMERAKEEEKRVRDRNKWVREDWEEAEAARLKKEEVEEEERKLEAENPDKRSLMEIHKAQPHVKKEIEDKQKAMVAERQAQEELQKMRESREAERNMRAANISNEMISHVYTAEETAKARAAPGRPRAAMASDTQGEVTAYRPQMESGFAKLFASYASSPSSSYKKPQHEKAIEKEGEEEARAVTKLVATPVKVEEEAAAEEEEEGVWPAYEGAVVPLAEEESKEEESVWSVKFMESASPSERERVQKNKDVREGTTKKTARFVNNGGRKTRKYNKKNRKYRKKSQKKKITSNRKIKKKIKSRKKKYNKLLIRN